MADLYLSFPGNIAGHIKTPHDIHGDAQIRQQLEAQAPGIKFLDAQLENPSALLYLEHCPSDTPHLVVSGLHATLYAAKDIAFPTDIPHLLYGLERKALMQQKIYPVHAACVGKDGKYTLLVGHSGSGKTTLAQKLIEENGLKLFPGNKTAIRFDRDGIKAVAGTRIMTAVRRDFNRYAYTLRPEDLAPETEVKINNIVIVRINDGVEECQSLNHMSALHTLYPYFLDTVNADVVVNGKDVFSGTVPEEIRQYLTEHLGATLQIVPVRKVSGSTLYMQAKVGAP